MKTYLHNFTLKSLTKLHSLIITAFTKQKNLLPRLRYSFFFSASLLIASLFLLTACTCAGAGDKVETGSEITSLFLTIDGKDYLVTFDNNGAASVNTSSTLASFPSKLTIKSIALSDGATVKDQDGNAVTSESTVSISADGSARSITLTVTAEDGSTTRTYSISLIPQAPLNTDANIDSLILVIAGNERSVSFDDTGNASITITASLENPPSQAMVKKISVSAGATAKQGNNDITAGGSMVTINTNGDNRSISLSVTANDGTTRDYTININITTTTTNSDANIDILILVIASNERSVSFDDTGNASITITASLDNPPSQATVKNMTVSSGATAKQSNNDITAGSMLTITTNGDDRFISLSVTAQDGTTRDYIINITITTNSDANIDSLTLEIAGSDHSISFDAGGNDSITISASLENPPTRAMVKNISVSSGATAKQSNNDITAGSMVTINTNGDNRSISLSVTANDGTTRDYTINITITNSDANIDSLTLEIAGSDHSISFDADGNASITISASLDNPPSQAMVKNMTVSSGATAKQSNNDLTAGSMVTIDTNGDNRSISLSVTAADGTTRDYTINISITNSDANIDSLTLTIGSTDYEVAFGAVNSAEVKFESGDSTIPASLSVKTLVLSANATATDQSRAAITTGTDVTSPSTVTIATSGTDRSISITVTAEDGSTRTYTVNIVPVRSDAAITALTLNILSTDYQVSFDTSDRATIDAPITDSSVAIPASVTVTAITLATGASATVAGSTASVTGGSTLTLVDGGGFQRSLTLVVENGARDSTRTYEIVVQFANNQTEIIALSMTVGQTNFPITFDQNNQATVNALYRFSANPNTVTINTLTVPKGATVTDSGGISIDNGSSIPITGNIQTIILTVTAEDGVSTRDYTITLDYISITLSGHGRHVFSIAFNGDGSKLASGSVDETVKIWDATVMADSTNSITLSGHTDFVRAVAFSPDDTKLASGVYDNTIKIWDANATANTSTPIVTLSAHNHWVTSVAFHPNDSKLASSSYDDTIMIWDVSKLDDNTPTAPLILSLSGHSNNVSSVAFSPDGSRLASGSHDNTVKIWDASKLNDQNPTAPLIVTLSGHTEDVESVAFSPDSSKLASGSDDNTIRIWNANATANTSTPIATLSGHTHWVVSVAFSPDGSRLASGSYDNTIKIWNANVTANTSTPITTLSGHTDYVRSIAFNPDPDVLSLASGSYDNTIKIWR